MQSRPIQRPIRAGVFTSLKQADRVVDRLLQAGIPTQQLTVMCTDRAVQRHFEELHHEDPAGTHTPTTAAVGGAIGAALGGLAAVTATAVTGGAALLAAGGLALVTGGVFGGLVGAMVSRGVEKETADYYDQAVQEGKILVAVEVEEGEVEKLRLAEQIIADEGAEPLPLREG